MWPPPPSAANALSLQTSLRRLTLAIGAVETLALVYFAGIMLQSSDPMGAAIGRAVAMLMAVPYVVLTLPGIVLAWKNRWLPLALALVTLAIPVAVLFWRQA
jgi:hypothetical protein